MSAVAQRVRGKLSCGRRRAIPTISSTAGSSTSARSRLVPTLPVAPMTTTRMTAVLTRAAAGANTRLSS
jgi:hypothetical protein